MPQAVGSAEPFANPGTLYRTPPAGAGLGLAIVSEVLEQYGETLSLGRSRLGGLKASFRLPG